MVSAKGMGSVDMQMLETEEILKLGANAEQWWPGGVVFIHQGAAGGAALITRPQRNGGSQASGT